MGRCLWVVTMHLLRTLEATHKAVFLRILEPHQTQQPARSFHHSHLPLCVVISFPPCFVQLIPLTATLNSLALPLPPRLPLGSPLQASILSLLC